MMHNANKKVFKMSAEEIYLLFYFTWALMILRLLLDYDFALLKFWFEK